MSIIGKSYRSFDNSYMLNLSSSEYDANQLSKLPLFAACGANDHKYILSKVISEPYIQTIDGTPKVFINALYRDHTYRVLYHQRGLDARPYWIERDNGRFDSSIPW